MEDSRKVKYTKMMLRQSLIKLMETQHIDKIKITDICGLADVNRGTFYNHYSQPYDILAQIEEELYTKILKMIGEKSISELQFITEIFVAISENHELCKILLGEYGDKEFLKRIMYVALDRSISEWRVFSKIENQSTLEMVYEFYLNGVVGLVQIWIKNGMKETPSEMANMVYSLGNFGIKSFLSGNDNYTA